MAIASVPVQRWGELYSQDEALKAGTIFKNLDMPFFAADQTFEVRTAIESALKSPEEQKYQEKMREVQKISFLADDLRLYLDTHPDDQDALSMFKEVSRQRKQKLSEFAAHYQPVRGPGR